MTRRILFCALSLLAACTNSHINDGADGSVPDVGPPPAPLTGSASALIDGSGGELSLSGLRVEIPAGALSEPTMVTVTATDDAAPSGLTLYSRVLRFAPEGLRFARPIRVTIPFAGDARYASVYWTTEGGQAFSALPTAIDGHDASAETSHFSRAFVGAGCQGDACCTRATGELDVLFMVDNSNSMSEEQASLVAELPRMAQALATGDLDGDGVQDVSAARSIHVGVVSSDMGTGGYLVPTCTESNFGDDGVLQTRGNTGIAGCVPSYPSFLAWDTDAADFDVSASAADFTCMASIGTGGCGFEQPLAATLKAVTPSSSPLTFTMGTRGHGDLENTGFLRPGATLAVILMTDEDDCSAADPDLFDQSSARYAGDLNLRCFEYPEALQSTDRYVDGLLALKDDPSRVVFATISGVPTDLEGASFTDVLADPRMQQAPDPSMPSRLTPSCSVPGRGIAFPPVRLVQTARSLRRAGASAYVGSICQADFSSVVEGILEHTARSLGGSCGAP
ncbi:MAG: hypothetical protein GXP55_16750 [Deltaproteobacteria bacterium]|nr:hypothetical protein [Deltaproteobacteria bacterium]